MAISILIVEDDSVCRNALKQIVEDADDMQLVGIAGDYAGGIAFLDQTPADILLVDLGLPDGDGIELIKAVKRGWQDQCGVMVISIYADSSRVISAFEAGALGYLLKDSSPTATAQIIRDFHAGGSHITPIIARLLLKDKFPQVGANSNSSAGIKIPLSDREHEALKHLAKGHSYKEAARLMEVSIHTVGTFVKQVYDKLGVNSKIEAVNAAKAAGIKLD